MGRLINFMIPIQQIIVKIRDMFAKVAGVAVSAIYTSIGTYYTLKSFLGSIVTISISLLIALVALIILSFAFLPWLLPITLSLMSFYVAAAIPLAIIVVFLTETMGIQVNMGIPQQPSMPAMSSCFDKNTPIYLYSESNIKKTKPISEIELGDVLYDGGVVTAIMKLSTENIEMYKLLGIIVSGDHYVKYLKEWIPVKLHPNASLLQKYKEPFIYCLNTTTKQIPTFFGSRLFFMDWDEIFPEKRHFASHAVELLEVWLIDKPVRALRQAMRGIAFLQTGQIQHYILYPFVFILIIFILSLLNLL
jgi:hypothetical protein